MKNIWMVLILTVSVHGADIQVFFSPKGGCTEAVVNNLNKATNSVLVQAYSFTSAPIAKALVDAQKRGVKVHAILDRSQRKEKYTEADFLLHADVPTYIDAKHAIGVGAKSTLLRQIIPQKAADGQCQYIWIIHDTPPFLRLIVGRMTADR